MGIAKDIQPERTQWLDFMKGIAIIAVIADHVFWLFPQYLPAWLHPYTFFSVPLFVFLAGWTAALSYERHQDDGIRGVLKRLPHILVPYVCAVFCCVWIRRPMLFDLTGFLKELFLFSASPPHYFVFFFLQLMLIAPILYRLLVRRKKYDGIRIPACLLFLLAAAVWATFCTRTLPLHGGGAKLFGGFFLFHFALGMTAFRFRRFADSPAVTSAGFVIMTVLTLILKNNLDRFTGKFAETAILGINPSGLFYTVFTASVFFGVLFFRNIFLLLKRRVRLHPAFPEACAVPFIYCGRCSYMIFLFHMIPLTCIKKSGLELSFPSGPFTSILFTVFCTLSAVVFPVLMQRLGKGVREMLKQAGKET